MDSLVFIYVKKRRKAESAWDALVQDVVVPARKVILNDRRRIYMSRMIGESKGDYLKAIYILKKENGACRSVDVANYLGVSKSSTSIAIKKLEQELLVEKQGWRILLTDKGMSVAESLYEKECFFKNWFREIGVSDRSAEVDAGKIEHSISEETYFKIREFVGHNVQAAVLTKWYE